MELRECKKCRLLKPHSEFRKKTNSDKLLSRCKHCMNCSQRENRKKLRDNQEWVEAEKERMRNRYHRLGYKDTRKPTTSDKQRFTDSYRGRFPEKTQAKEACRSIKLEKGFEKHHWSYLAEHRKDITPLLKADHSKLHRFIVYDQERMMYRRFDNNILLDTKEAHLAFWEEIKNL